MYVIALTHFLDERGLPLEGRAARVADYYGRIAAAGSLRPVGDVFWSAVACRRRPGRRACPGHLWVRRRKDGVIEWQCPHCPEEAGVISRWQGTFWDRSGFAGSGDESGIQLALTDTEYLAVRRAGAFSSQSWALLDGAGWDGRAVAVRGSGAALAGLGRELAAMPGRLRPGGYRRPGGRGPRELVAAVAVRVADLVGGGGAAGVEQGTLFGAAAGSGPGAAGAGAEGEGGLEAAADALFTFAHAEYGEFVAEEFLAVADRLPLGVLAENHDGSATGFTAALEELGSGVDALTAAMVMECVVFDVPLPDGETILAKFLDRHRERLGAQVFGLLQRWSGTTVEVWEVLAADADGVWAVVQNTSTGEKLRLSGRDGEPTWDVEAGDLVVARLVPWGVGPGARHDCVAGYVPLPGFYEQRFFKRLGIMKIGADLLTDGGRGARGERGERGGAPFMRRFGWLVVLVAGEMVAPYAALAGGDREQAVRALARLPWETEAAREVARLLLDAPAPAGAGAGDGAGDARPDVAGLARPVGTGDTRWDGAGDGPPDGAEADAGDGPPDGAEPDTGAGGPDIGLLAAKLWLEFHLHAAPLVRKPAAMAAALEYFVAKYAGAAPALTQTAVAARYGVSSAAVAKRVPEIMDYLDRRYPPGDPEETAPPPGREAAGGPPGPRGESSSRLLPDEPRNGGGGAGSRTVYQLKITLQGIKPPIWRRVLVPGGITFLRLHKIIQAAFDWQDYHLFDFDFGGVVVCIPDPDFAPGEIYGDRRELNAKRTKIDELLERRGRCVYTYDFGDNWRHQVVLEKVLPAEDGRRYPVCVAGKRHRPPEDVGGIPGYEEFLQAIRDPADPEHERYLTRAEKDTDGEEFDPEHFDLNQVNRALARLRR